MASAAESAGTTVAAPHLHAVQQHAVGQSHAVANLAQRADGDVRPDLAALADGDSFVHNDVAREGLPRCQLLRLPSAEGVQVQCQACIASRQNLFLETIHSYLILEEVCFAWHTLHPSKATAGAPCRQGFCMDGPGL